MNQEIKMIQRLFPVTTEVAKLMLEWIEIREIDLNSKNMKVAYQAVQSEVLNSKVS